MNFKEVIRSDNVNFTGIESSYLKDGEGFAGLLQSYNNFAGNLWLLVVLSALFSSIIVMKIKETRQNFQ